VSTEGIPAHLETDRLLLRRWTSADAEPFAIINADPEVMEHIDEPLTRAQSDAFLARIQSQFDDVGYGLWAVEVRETGPLVGFTGLAVTGHSAPPPLRSRWAGGWAARGGRHGPELSGSWRRAA
jgi:RimJ/RimL family protein N-acetyltransferase